MSTRHAMGSADAAWLHMDRPTNLMVINSVMWFGEPIDWDRCRAIFLERIVDRFDRFRQRPAGGSWEDVADFDPDLHFHRLALPAPGDRRALQELVGDRASMPLDRTRPLWEVCLVDGYGAGCAVLVRMHHAIADGIALAQVMLTLTDDEDARDERGFADVSTDGGSRIGGAARLAGVLARSAQHPRATLGDAIGDVQTLGKLLLPSWDARSAIRGEQHAAHRVAWSEPVALWRVKRTAKALGATVNDVLVAAVAGAVAEYADAQGARPEEVHALVPFNLRPLDEPLPKELGNRFGLIVLALPLDIENPVLRVAEVKRRMDAIKDGHEGAISYGILELMGRTPASVEARLIDYFSAKASMVLTNVPGPGDRLSVAGTPLSGVLVWAPCSGSIGMSVSVFSYAGRVTVGFLTDASVVRDPDALAAGFRAELLACARAAR